MKNYQKITSDEIIPKFKEKFGYKNSMATPKITKVSINVGVGLGQTNNKIYDVAEKTLKTISGQKPVFRHARMAISGFKLRQGAKIGLMVTLRGKRMEDFITRFIHLVIPRFRDFRGLDNKSFDEKGNYSIGITEQTVFPEIKYEEIEIIHGMQINFTTSAKNKIEAQEIFKLLGFPFKK